MYNHNGGYQTQNMINGAQNHQRYGGMHMPKFQPNHHGHHNQVNQHHNAHHHNSHIGHQHNVSSGTFQSTTPQFQQEHIQNNHRNDGISEDMEEGNEFWLEQRRLCDDYATMNAPHERARTVAQQSKGMNFGGPLGGDEMSLEDRSRTLTTTGQSKQVWSELDLGGQGLRALAPALFDSYQFLTRLDLGHNHLHHLPPAIGKLVNLEFLDLSYNELDYLPEEIGMLTNLRTLLLFANQIQVLNPELGYLQKLETLGVYGNPLDDELKAKMSDGGTRNLILYLRETMPGKMLS